MQETPPDSIALGIQLAVCGAMMVVLTIVHVVGLTAISRVLNLRKERLRDLDFDFHALGLMCAMGLFLLLLHSIEIWIFAGLYLALGIMETLSESLHFSASAYATLGRTSEYFPENWRLLGAVEAVIGFLLIGWSTAFIVSKADRLMPD